MSAGLVAVLAMVAGGSALRAQIAILGVSAETEVLFTRADPLTPLASATDSTAGTPALEASSLLTLPGYTSPSGSPLDTGWQPATARAYQSELGFNSTLVRGAFANGQTVNRLDAITTWTLTGTFASVLFQLPHELTLDYLIFPGEVGLSSFAPAGSRAGFSVEIRGGPIFSQDIVFAEQVQIARATGSLTPTLTVGPTFAGAGITSGVINRDFMNYSHVATQPFTGATSLGFFFPGAVFEVTYTMHAWMQVPGYEVAGFASIADPFALTSDPATYLAQVFPGLDFPGFTITATPAPVPEPATWALLAGAVALTLAVWRRRRAGVTGGGATEGQSDRATERRNDGTVKR